MQTRPTHVYIVDDSQPIRARLAHLLGSLPHVTVVGQAASASEAIAGILRVKPDSVLLDLNLMGSTGIDVMRQVRPGRPRSRLRRPHEPLRAPISRRLHERRRLRTSSTSRATWTRSPASLPRSPRRATNGEQEMQIASITIQAAPIRRAS
jgi:CheY-like chemotaxis protein